MANRTEPYPDCSDIPGSNPDGCRPCWALNKSTRECAWGEGGVNWFGYQHPQYWDVCKEQWRCILGDWVNDNERTAYDALLLDARKEALRWYGPYSEDEERTQVSEAVLRYWAGPNLPDGAKVDRGPGITPTDPKWTVDWQNGTAQDRKDAIDHPPEVLERYYEILNGGDLNASDLMEPNGPWQRGLALSKKKRLTEFGAIAPKHYRDLHPVGGIIQGVEHGLEDPDEYYWLPYSPHSTVAVRVSSGGKDEFRTTLQSLAKTYNLDDYIGRWQDQQNAQIGIIAQRIAHTIGSAVLAAFPVTSAWAAPAYAAGNALIDMQQSILDQDGSWVDAFNSMNEAGLAFLEVGSSQQIPGTDVDAKLQNDGQYVTGGQWSTPSGADAGGAGDTPAMQDVNNWAQASIDGADAAQRGDWAGVQAAFEQYGFDLPDDFLNDLVGELATITGHNNDPYSTTEASSIRVYTGPRQAMTMESLAAGLAAHAGMTPGEFEAATGTRYGSGAAGGSTAVVLAVLGLIVGLAWIL
jgi:hypothetical protein